MLPLAALTFLQGALCVAMGENLPYPISPSVNGEEKALFSDTGVVRTVIPDTKSDIDVGFPKRDVGDQEKSWSRNGPEIMECFTNNFIKKIKASKKLQEAFEVQRFDAESLSHFYYDYVFKAHSFFGAPDAPVSARVVSDAVALNFDKLKKEDALLRIYSGAVADYLFFRGYLNPSNVASLSQEYFRFTEEYVNSIKNSSPEANIKAIADAFTDFLCSLGLVSPYSTVMVAGVFSSRWYFL